MKRLGAIVGLLLAIEATALAAPCDTAPLWGSKLSTTGGKVLYDVAKKDNHFILTIIVDNGKGSSADWKTDNTAFTCFDGGDQAAGKGLFDHVWGCQLPDSVVASKTSLPIAFHATFGGAACDFNQTIDLVKITALPITNAKDTNPYTGKPWTIGDVLLAVYIYDAAFDVDGDGVRGFKDNCPFTANADQKKSHDGMYGDACDPDNDGVIKEWGDSCPFNKDTDWQNTDHDDLADSCDPDDDNDGALDAKDNCPLIANMDQADLDKDGKGDACDDDVDGNGIADILEIEADTADAASTDDDGICKADELFDATEKKCYPDIDSDGDGLIDALDHCNGVVDPTNGCNGAELSTAGDLVDTEGTAKDGGCSLITHARSRDGTATLLGAVVLLWTLAMTRLFRSK